MEINRIVNGYTVEIETDTDGAGTTGCWISKGRFHASLAALEGTGELESDEAAIAVPQSTIAAIRRLAERHGY